MTTNVKLASWTWKTVLVPGVLLMNFSNPTEPFGVIASRNVKSLVESISTEEDRICVFSFSTEIFLCEDSLMSKMTSKDLMLYLYEDKNSPFSCHLKYLRNVQVVDLPNNLRMARYDFGVLSPSLFQSIESYISI